MYLINMMIASFFASLGFGVMFNIRGRKLILAGIAGSIGGAVYHAALLVGCSESRCSVIFSRFSRNA